MLPVPRRSLLLGSLALAACGNRDGLDRPKVDLGDFRLGHNIVVTDTMQKVPVSRDATGEEWQAVLTKAVADRFGRYEGDKFYNIGINVDAYAIAPPFVPLVAGPKSILVITVAVFDDAAGQMLNPGRKGHQISAFERGSIKTRIGSGLTQTKEEQMANLAFEAVSQIEDYLRANRHWFGLPPAAPGETASDRR